MEGFLLRVNDYEGYGERLGMMVSNTDYTKVLCVKHKGDKKIPNEHFHMTVLTQVNPQAFRKRMLKIFDKGKGNGHMSIVPWDGRPEANSYMFHEEQKGEQSIVPVCNKGYSSEDLKCFSEMNEKIQIEIKLASEKASYKLIHMVYTNLKGRKMPTRQIAEEILLTAYRTKLYVPNDFKLKDFADEVQWMLCEHDDHLEFQMVRDRVSRIKWD